MFVPPRLNAALRCAVKWAPVLVKATAGSFKSNMLDDMVIQQHMPWWEAIYERFSLKGPADETLYIHNKLHKPFLAQLLNKIKSLHNHGAVNHHYTKESICTF